MTNDRKHKNGTFKRNKIAPTESNLLQFLVSQHALLRASEVRLTGALSNGGKMRGVATNVYLWKTSEKTEGNWS